MTVEELQALVEEEQEATQNEVSSEEEEEKRKGPVPTSAVKEFPN